MKPYHGRPYPILRKHKAVLMKEIKRLYDIRVLEWQPSSQWVSPTFIIPKKDSTVCAISDFRELNKHIVRKPYPIPKISVILQELEGFTYATALVLNMGYSTIRLDPMASKMCTIIFPWVKFSHEATHGLWRLSQHIPSPNNGPDGIPQICTSIHGRFGNHHVRNTGRAPSKNGDSANQTA